MYFISLEIQQKDKKKQPIESEGILLSAVKKMSMIVSADNRAREVKF